MSDALVNRLRWAATLGDLTTTSARNLMEEATVRIAELEAEVKGWRNEDKKKQTACEQMVRRIAELEAALQRIASAGGLFSEPASGQHAREIARAALEGGKE